MKNPRVAFVGNFYQSDAKAIQVCEELARRLSARGISIITTSKRVNRVLRVLDMVTTVLFQRSRFELAIVDVFSGPSFQWAAAVGWLLKKLGKPFVYVLHGGGLPDYSKSREKRIIRVLGQATEVVAPSNYLAEAMSPYRKGIKVIPNGIEVDSYPFHVRDGAVPRIVWLRAFHRVYYPTMAPRVLKLVKERFPEARLVMVGPDKDGSLKETVRVAEEEGVREAVEFTGPLPKERVPEAMNRGDIFINTTTVDNTPVSVIEAMACGLCAVSTNVGGIPYLLEDGQDALLVPGADPEAMAHAVLRILHEPGLAKRVSSGGRRKAESMDWKLVLPMWERLMIRVAGDD